MLSPQELQYLYQETVLDHSRSPRNFFAQENTPSEEAFNPLCGDHVILYLASHDNKIQTLSFQGSGCAICMASSSMMTEYLQEASFEKFEELFQHFQNLVTQGPEQLDSDAQEQLNDLIIFNQLHTLPSRIKCAMIVWHAMHSLIVSAKDLKS